jgi:kynurenine formamidase
VESWRELGARLNNWGRWGQDDERGTVNFITPDKLVAAAALVRRGVVFDLGIPFDAKGPQPRGIRVNPIHTMSATGANQEWPGGYRYADDYVTMPLQCASQWDALSHVFYDDQLYNGYPSSMVDVGGANRNSIDKMAKGIVGRGVLIDIALLKGVESLEAGYVITPSDLDEASSRQGVEVGSGDIVLVRTGWRNVFTSSGDPDAFMRHGEPGIGLATCEWLHDREVAAIGCDNYAVEVVPSEADTLPVHLILIRDMGMTLGEIFDFEELSADCASDGIYDFFFTAPPIKFTKAVGSPINPLAIK